MSPRGSRRLGPFGPDVEVAFSEHALRRARERFGTAPKDLDDLVLRIRTPNAARSDEWDARARGVVVLRWIRAGGRLLRIASRTQRRMTDEDGGAILIVTVVVEDR
jgi:hypothetical protein